MSLSISKPWISGLGILVVAHAAWLALFQQEQFVGALAFLLWGSSFLAATLVALLSPTRKFTMGLSMALPAAILSLTLNFLHQSLGHAVDFPGLSGAITLLTVSLAYNVPLCALGAGLGIIMARNQSPG